MKRDKTPLPVSYYEILQISESAGDIEVRSAYHKLAKRFHPDRNKDERKLAELRFKIINEAYATLKTKEKRDAYRRIMKKNRKTHWNGAGRPINDNINPHKQGGFLANLGRFFKGQ